MTTAPPGGHVAVAPDPAAANDRIVGEAVVRFDGVERVVHWLSALLVLAAVATGMILYVRPLAVAVGRRELIKDIHVISGLASLIPFLVAMAGPWSRGLRRDVSRFANWHRDDTRWFRRSLRPRSETGKFNGGQKLNAVLAASGLVVMTISGSIMKWFGPFPLEWRTGATFVHDWVSFGLWILIFGHVFMAVITRGAIRGIWTGRVPIADAQSRPRWWVTIDRGR